ncbi:MAG TPA: hypothetical protein VN380_11895 [Thermoanaerobaculia bacterium]|jgi:hypothetical protein|nr:hypothetical protein [Thermoanaerobaculia bacterium]
MTGVARSHLRTAWELLEHHWAAFLLAQLTIVAAWVALEIAVVAAHRSGIPAVAFWPLWSCLHLAFFWVFCGLMAGIHRMALQAVDGGIPTFATAVGSFNRSNTYLFTSLLYWVAVTGGLVLAVVPGLVVAVTFAPFRFLLVEGTQNGLSSLREATLLSASHRWRIFRTLSVSAALNLGGAAFLGVGLLVTFPLTVLLRASQFRALQDLSLPTIRCAP